MKNHSKALVFFAVSKQISVVYSADRGRAETTYIFLPDIYYPPKQARAKLHVRSGQVVSLFGINFIAVVTYKPQHDKTNECARSEDSDQPGHPRSLIRVFNVRSVGS